MKYNRFSDYWRLDPKVLIHWLQRTLIVALFFVIIYFVFDLWSKKTPILVGGILIGIINAFYLARKEYRKKSGIE